MYVDLDLIRRYNRPVPRYTSYPTAPHFSDAIGGDDFRAEVDATNADASAGPISLYLHLPFCRQLCYYCGCHMKVTHDPARIEKYLGYLMRDIEQLAARIHPEREVVQIHWGGGTPTYLAPEQIRSLSATLHEQFTVADDAEISLEADPRGLTEDHVAAASAAGFNRISIGVQDFDEAVQEAINRIQPEPMVRDAVRWSRAHGFGSINLDLVYGLPHQSVDQFRDTVDTIIDIDPDRIALFSYAHVPSIKQHQQLIPDDALPSPAEKLSIFKMAIERLTEAGGYRFIGMDHFARPDDELARAQDAGELHRNFQGYSTRAGADVFAFGISGIHQLRNLYAQNVKGLRPYYDRMEAGDSTVYRGYRLTDDDHIRRHVIMELMCHFRLDKRRVEERFDLDFDAYFADALRHLQPLEADGLVRVDDASITIPERGRLLVRPAVAAFDAYYQQPDRSRQPVYSQSV